MLLQPMSSQAIVTSPSNSTLPRPMSMSTGTPLSPSPSPISFLPVEILARIFVHIPRAEFYETLHSSFSNPFGAPPSPTAPQLRQPTLMAIAQVCRRWRAIASNCKAFWSFVPLAAAAASLPMRWAELLLTLSDPSPISLLVDCSGPACSSVQTESYRRAALATLQAAFPRAREIHLQSSSLAFAFSTDQGFRQEAMRLLDASAAPSLEVLSVRSQTGHDFVTLSDNIFLHHVPTALRSLTLTYCDVYHTSPLFRAPLTFLSLANCQVEFPLEILSFLPHLHTLVLESTRGACLVRKRNSSPLEALCLPNLQRLELTNLSAFIAFILQAIHIPPSSSLCITCTDYLEIDEPLDDLTLLQTIISNMSPALSAHLERRALVEYHRTFPILEIASPSATSKKTLVLYDPETIGDSTSETRQLLFSLVWASTSSTSHDKGNNKSSPTIDLFTQMLSALPPTVLRHIHTLRMRDAADARPRPDPFVAHRNKARDEAVRGLLAMVTRQELLPALRQVLLEEVDFEHFDVDLLARVFVDRHRAATSPGGKVSLSLRNCPMGVGKIRGLRDCLGQDAFVVDYA